MSYLEMRGITKNYGRVAANSQVDFSLERGEIHSILGENGAGKTTLMRILYGMVKPDEGTIAIDGKPVSIARPKDAIAQGISMVHQHFMLVDSLTVTENIVLGYEPHHGPMFDFEASVKEVEGLSQSFALKVDARAKIADIPIGEKQRVEIIKALYRKSELIILDEPTAVLTSLEVQDLFKVLNRLREAGKTIVIITHKLKEVMQISDRVTVMSRGRQMCTKNTADTTPDELVELMVGRKLTALPQPEGAIPADAPVYLELRDVVVNVGKVPKLRGLDLKVQKGEILGICGVEGNGQTELVEVVTGLAAPSAGQVLIKGEVAPKATALGMLKKGVAHIPEDRTTRGLIKNFTISSNLILGYHWQPAYCRHGVLRWKDIERLTAGIAQDYDIRTDDITNPVSSLSGGNQQKVVIARALSHRPDIVVAAQPTRGVDIGAIEYIHKKLVEIKDSGKAVLLISAEIDELMALSDNIAVLYEGKIVAQGPAAGFDEKKLGMLMTGMRLEAANEG